MNLKQFYLHKVYIKDKKNNEYTGFISDYFDADEFEGDNTHEEIALEDPPIAFGEKDILEIKIIE